MSGDKLSICICREFAGAENSGLYACYHLHLKTYSSMGALLSSFCIDACCMGYDGVHFYTIARGRKAHDTGMNMVLFGEHKFDWTTLHRLWKQGFFLVCLMFFFFLTLVAGWMYCDPMYVLSRKHGECFANTNVLLSREVAPVFTPYQQAVQIQTTWFFDLQYNRFSCPKVFSCPKFCFV